MIWIHYYYYSKNSEQLHILNLNKKFMQISMKLFKKYIKDLELKLIIKISPIMMFTPSTPRDTQGWTR